MSAEDKKALEWSWGLQWQPLDLAPSKEERYAQARRERRNRQRQREENVIFWQTLIFMAFVTVLAIFLILLGGTL